MTLCEKNSLHYRKTGNFLNRKISINSRKYSEENEKFEILGTFFVKKQINYTDAPIATTIAIKPSVFFKVYHFHL